MDVIVLNDYYPSIPEARLVHRVVIEDLKQATEFGRIRSREYVRKKNEPIKRSD